MDNKELLSQSLDIIQQLSTALKEAENENTVLKEKLVTWERIQQSEVEIEFSEIAKILAYKNWGRNKIFKLLRNKGVLLKTESHLNQPTQPQVDNGNFRIVEEKFVYVDGREDIYRKTVASQKGLDFIRKLIEEEIRAKENNTKDEDENFED